MVYVMRVLFPPQLQADPVPPEGDGEGEGVASSSGDEEWELESEGEEGRKGVKRYASKSYFPTN